jgi:tetratricopeptide (TPR) repeat protein
MPLRDKDEPNKLVELDASSQDYERIANSSTNSIDRAAALNRLAVAFREDYSRTQDPQYLNDAIRVSQEALALTPPESPIHWSALSNLGAALSLRYAFTRDIHDLENAVRIYKEALALSPSDWSQRPIILNNLGITLGVLYDLTGEMQYLERALDVYEQAVSLTPLGSSERATVLNNLSINLNKRHPSAGRWEPSFSLYGNEISEIILTEQKLTPDYLSNVVSPFLSATANIQYVLDEALRRPYKAVLIK